MQRTIWLDGFLGGLQNTMFGLAIILLIVVTRGRGILAILAYSSVAAAMATGWAKGAIYYAVADAAHHGGADAGVLALVSLARTMDYGDAIFVTLTVGGVSVLALRTHMLPALLAWFRLLVAVEHVISTPAQIAATSTGNDIEGPISIGLGVLWLLALAIMWC